MTSFFIQTVKELEEWLVTGRKRMDDLLKPEANMLPEERVMFTMELQSDIEEQIKKHGAVTEVWNSIQPTEPGEKSDESDVRCFLVGGKNRTNLFSLLRFPVLR